MAQIDDLYTALRNADAAGDTVGAQRLASYIKTLAPPSAAAAPMATPDPTEGNSFLDNALIGTGKGMASIARAVGLGPLLDKVVPGLPASKAEATQLDAPLMKTAGGQAGNVLGQAATLAPAMFVPGANTYAGAATLGGVLGAGTTEGSLADRAKGGLYGALGGATGKAAGDLIGLGANALGNAAIARAAAKQSANAGRDAAAANALQAGYVLPPTEINPTTTNSLLEGLSGKIKTSQAASARNQSTTNKLAQDALGLPNDAPISIDALNKVRANAGQAYDAVSSAGTITPGQKYSDALDAITKPYVQAASAFPNAKVSPVIAEIDALRSPSFDAASAVAKIKTLRGDADTAYATGNKDLGSSLKAGANALEDAIDSHLVSTGAPADTLQNFRDARQLIAKTYSVQKGLNDSTGDVSAKTLAGLLQRGKPLSGELKTIAQTGQSFPKATQSLQQNYNPVSPLDYMAGLLSEQAAGLPGLAATAARPAVRSMILSGPYQRMAARGVNYDPNALAQLLQGTFGGPNRIAPILGTTLLPASQ